MELHMVFYKSEYESMEEAMKNKDGLLVLALFYEVCKELFQVYIYLDQRSPNYVGRGMNENI